MRPVPCISRLPGPLLERSGTSEAGIGGRGIQGRLVSWTAPGTEAPYIRLMCPVGPSLATCIQGLRKAPQTVSTRITKPGLAGLAYLLLRMHYAAVGSRTAGIECGLPTSDQSWAQSAC